MIFITGMPRSGTTMLLLMMQDFEKLNVIVEEKHPLKFSQIKKNSVIKQPYGYFEDFRPKYTYRRLLKEGYKIISLIRDPKDVLVSRHQSNPTRYWVSVKVIMRAANEHLKYINDTRVLSIKYEDLVSNPDKEMHRIEKYIGMKINNNFKNFHITELAKKCPSLNGPRPIETSRIGVWKNDRLRVRQAMTVELAKLTENLGYA